MARKTATTPAPVPVAVPFKRTTEDCVGAVSDYCKKHIKGAEEYKASFIAHIQTHGVEDAGRWMYVNTAKQEILARHCHKLLESTIARMQIALKNEADPLTTVKKEMTASCKHLQKYLVGKARDFTQSTCSITNLNSQLEGSVYAEMLEEFTIWNEELNRVGVEGNAPTVPQPTAV